MKNNVAVIGGGASGIFAAITARKAGADVTIFEKNSRVGKKILSTGNGACNFTNSGASPENYNTEFVSCALLKLTPSKTCELFRELGLLSMEKDEGRIYPLSAQASAVLDVLRFTLDRLGVKLVCDFDVAQIIPEKDGFFVMSKSGKRHFADKVIVATGGMAAPKTGSSGDGYKLLEKLGHTKTELIPHLVQIKTDRGISGVRAHARVTMQNGKTQEGEVQFNNYGLSGIPVFMLSKYAKLGEKISVDLLPDYEVCEVEKILKNRPTQALETYLIGILNKTLGQMLLKECVPYPLSTSCDKLADSDIEKIAKTLKNWEFTISGTMPWDNAQVTAGGISLSEVNPDTLESRLVKNLYIVGELLDIDGDCGGYNLQWAWSSGYVAGSEAANVQN